ncbi:MAG TPA: hypothetical protein P5223_05190 [Phycisphaerae bacterium]|nr:hypothetical protein [Phycisphaerae bacterium]
MIYDDWPPVMFFAFLVTGFGLAAAVVCWCGHRTIAAGAFTWWTQREPLPDGRWALKVMAYESAFLWVFCTFWGLLITSFLFFEDWISDALGRQAWLGTVPAEVSVIAQGTIGLGAVWLWRYRIAFLTIRWSNF